MKLQDRLDAFTAELIKGGKIPESLVAKQLEGIKDQVASGSADRALKAGDVAPAFRLKDAKGVSVSSAELVSHGPLVATFYRGVLVSILQFGITGSASIPCRDRSARRIDRRAFDAERSQQPEVATRKQVGVSDPGRWGRYRRRRIRPSLLAEA